MLPPLLLLLKYKHCICMKYDKFLLADMRANTTKNSRSLRSATFARAGTHRKESKIYAKAKKKPVARRNNYEAYEE